MAEPEAVVYVIDDDASMRASIESLLRSVGHTVVTFDSTQSFLEFSRPEGPACVVLDVRMPGASGLELQRELAAAGSAIPIIFVTGHGDIAMSVAAMKAGALEFLTKPFRDQDLLDAVHRGLEEDRRRSRRDLHLDALRERYALLTSRERQVMRMAAAGLLNKQIAAELALSEVTVKVHRANAMQKMQARSLPDLVRMSDSLGAHIQES
ncbi:response regulator transcription factor [Microbaculum marinum]|uniref:Response regulator n=1 Tax=Microbaculum marinum TaxID=1764581 RepID=A0AAW9RB98_9HYPH